MCPHGFVPQAKAGWVVVRGGKGLGGTTVAASLPGMWSASSQSMSPLGFVGPPVPSVPTRLPPAVCAPCASGLHVTAGEPRGCIAVHCRQELTQGLTLLACEWALTVMSRTERCHCPKPALCSACSLLPQPLQPLRFHCPQSLLFSQVSQCCSGSVCSLLRWFFRLGMCFQGSSVSFMADGASLFQR